jgi:uncharacterized membrane protein YphA (DoxX/SURF4 family)
MRADESPAGAPPLPTEGAPMTPLRRARLAAAWLLGAYLAALYVRMGWGKFESHGFWAASFTHWGYAPWFRVLVGVIEVAGGAALVVPWVASFGALALCAVMVGAAATLATDHRWHDVALVVAYAAGLAWISYEWWDLRLRSVTHRGGFARV